MNNAKNTNLNLVAKYQFDGSNQPFDILDDGLRIVAKNNLRSLELTFGRSFSGKTLKQLHSEFLNLEEKLEIELEHYPNNTELSEKLKKLREAKKILGIDSKYPHFNCEGNYSRIFPSNNRTEIIAKNNLRTIEIFLQVQISGKTLQEIEEVLNELSKEVAKELDYWMVCEKKPQYEGYIPSLTEKFKQINKAKEILGLN